MQSAVEAIWSEWKRVTRFLESSRIAFARERLLWSSLQITGKENLTVSTTDGLSSYRVNLKEHLAAIEEESDVLFSLVLTMTYALAESFGRLKLGISDDEDFSGGIESWGAKLLAATGNDWTKVKDGLVGALEVSIVRNAYAHGVRTVSQRMVNRFVEHSHVAPWAVGEKISLNYELVETYRARIKSLMRCGGTQKRSRLWAIKMPFKAVEKS